MPAVPSQKTWARTCAIGVFATAWIGAIVLGQRVMLDYDYTAAAPANPPVKWPTETSVPHQLGLPTLVVFAHPHCPCTRATIEELARLMARLQNRATAVVLFVRPQSASDGWEKTDLWQSAARIPGVTVLSDSEGSEASRFGAQASGQTLLYSAAGDLQFDGGITASRGHAGDSVGQTAIQSFVTTGHSATNRASVFGCSLHNPERASN
jgi:hypothetical protein